MSARRQRRDLAAWSNQTRTIARERARGLALVIAAGIDHGYTPYDIGIVLDAGETAWDRVPARYQTIEPLGWSERGTVEWVVTSHRLVGRLPGGSIESIAWGGIAGLRLDLAQDWVALDSSNGWRAVLSGPAIAPIAVAAVATCHGTGAMIEHPGLAGLRFRGVCPQPVIRRSIVAVENAAESVNRPF